MIFDSTASLVVSFHFSGKLITHLAFGAWIFEEHQIRFSELLPIGGFSFQDFLSFYETLQIGLTKENNLVLRKRDFVRKSNDQGKQLDAVSQIIPKVENSTSPATTN